MILTPIRRYGVAVLVLLTTAFSGEVLAKTYAATSSSNALLSKVEDSTKDSSKKEYSRNSAKSRSLPDLRQYPSGTPRKKAFLRTVMPYILSQNAKINADRNWLLSKQYTSRLSPSEHLRMKEIAQRYKVNWSGDMRKVPWSTLLERVDIIPGSMVATMAAAESGWGTSRLARANNNLFGMKCGRGKCPTGDGKVKGYSHFNSVQESVQAYVININTHPAYNSFRKSRAQLRKADQELTAATMIHKLKGYSTRGSSYNNFLFSMYRDNQRLIAAHM